MSTINKHHLLMTGLKAACAATKGLTYYGSRYVEIFYNRDTGAVWTATMTRGSWTVPACNRDIKIVDAHSYWTMQELADRIAYRVREVAWRELDCICA